MSATQIYLRIKRKNQTIFVHTELTDTVEALKTKLEGIVKVPRAEMRLYADVDSTLHPLADKDALEKLGVQPEQQLALVYKQPGSDDWEPIEITNDAADLETNE